MAQINTHDAKNLPIFIKKINELNLTVKSQIGIIAARDAKIKQLQNEIAKFNKNIEKSEARLAEQDQILEEREKQLADIKEQRAQASTNNNEEYLQWLKMIEEQEKDRLEKYQEIQNLFDEGQNLSKLHSQQIGSAK